MKVLITGSASGIGLACKNHFFNNYEIIELDKEQVDLSNPLDVEQYINDITKIDVLIYCAGVREIKNPLDVSIKEWNDVFNINVTSNFVISKKLIQNALTIKRKLNIINIASVSGFQGELDRAAYVSSKHALIGLTKQLAYQYGKFGVRVNAIAPGIIETPMTQQYFADDLFSKRIKANIPVGYWGNPQHILSIIELCLSNDYINGSVITCDGGWTAGRYI